jgi:hypothetical protein
VQIYIKYVGMLKDGKFVESKVNEKPYKFKLGNILSNTLIFVLNHEFVMSHNRSPQSSVSSHSPSSLTSSSRGELPLLGALTRPSLVSSAADVATGPRWTTVDPRVHESMHPAHNIFDCKINPKTLGKDSFEK